MQEYKNRKFEDILIKEGVEYRFVKLRGRAKYVSANGDLINPLRPNQKSTVSVNKDGYLCSGGGVPVHLYVAYGWVDGKFDNAEVHHKDFNRQNNNYLNLKWVSHKDNVNESATNHKNSYSYSKIGEKNGRANFTELEVIKIRKLYDDGMSVSDIVRAWYPNEQLDYNEVKKRHSTFLSIAKRKTWKHI